MDETEHPAGANLPPEETYVEDAPPNVDPSLTALAAAPDQVMFDRELLRQNLINQRQLHALNKLNYYAARAGIPGTNGHPKQHLATLRESQKALEFLEGLAAELEPLPMPPQSDDLDLPTLLIPGPVAETAGDGA